MPKAPILPETIATSAFADLVSLTPRRCQQLVEEGVLVRAAHGKLAFKASMDGFIAWRVKSETRAVTQNEGDDALDAERVRKLRLENDETERLIVTMDDAIAAIDAIVGPIPAELAGVPPRISDDITVRRKAEDEISAVCGEISKRLRQAGIALREGRDALASGAEDDADGMGEEE